MKFRLGLDLWDTALHVFVTICVAVALSEASHGHDGVIIPAVFASSAVVLSVRRRLALRRGSGESVGLTTGEVQQARLDEVELRLAEIEMLEARLAELENRVEFSERLLSQERNPPAARLEAR